MKIKHKISPPNETHMALAKRLARRNGGRVHVTSNFIYVVKGGAVEKTYTR